MSREQATVRRWDPVQGGSAVRDDGSEVLLPPDALQGSVFRLLHPGQRVALVHEDDRLVGVELV